MTEVPKAGHQVSMISYPFPCLCKQQLWCYLWLKDSLVPANILQSFQSQDNHLQLQKIDVEFAFRYEPQTPGSLYLVPMSSCPDTGE